MQDIMVSSVHPTSRRVDLPLYPFSPPGSERSDTLSMFQKCLLNEWLWTDYFSDSVSFCDFYIEMFINQGNHHCTIKKKKKVLLTSSTLPHFSLSPHLIPSYNKVTQRITQTGSGPVRRYTVRPCVQGLWDQQARQLYELHHKRTELMPSGGVTRGWVRSGKAQWRSDAKRGTWNLESKAQLKLLIPSETKWENIDLIINSKNLFPKTEENWHKLNTYTDPFDFKKLKVVTSDNGSYYKGNTNK